jgi:hypothetical protein
MSINSAVSCGPPPSRNPAQSLVPVLIQVPALPRTSRAPSRGATRRRRRLRREVRVAASAIVFAVPMTWAFLAVLGGPPEVRGSDTGRPTGTSGRYAIAADDGPRASITLEEPCEAAGSCETRPPVVLEEIVPDERSEGVARAGG